MMGRGRAAKVWALAGGVFAFAAVLVGGGLESRAQTSPPVTSSQALDIGDCPDTATSFEDGNIYVCACSGASSGTIYGTDVYTNDSNICQAAIHAGVLKKGVPGRVSVRMVASPRVFKGTTRNGIKSEVWVKPTPHAFEIAPAQ
jgi:hypothetical protein